MDNLTLQPLTRLILLASAVVQTLFGVLNLFARDLVNSLLWPAPLEPWPLVALQFHGLIYVCCAAGAAYALLQNNWIAARTIFAITGPYNALCIVVALINAAGAGIPLIMWVYVVLALIYVPMVAVAWRQQSARAEAMPQTRPVHQSMPS